MASAIALSSKSTTLLQTDLTLQLSALRNTPSLPPRGVYVVPSTANPLLLDGVLFVGSSGPYAGAVFRFTLQWSSVKPIVCFDPRCVPAHPLVQAAAPHRLNLTPLLAESGEEGVITLPLILGFVRSIFQPQYLRDVLVKRPDWFTNYNVDVGSLLVKQYGQHAQSQAAGGIFDSLAKQSVRLSLSPAVLYGHGRGTAKGEGEAVKSNIVFPEELLSKGRKAAEEEQERELWMEQLKRDIFYGDEDGGGS